CPQERLLLILNENQIPMLITTSKKAASFKRFSGKVLIYDKEPKLAEQSIEEPKIVVQPQQLAYIIFTSGSTGKPKGVLIEHQSIVNYARWFADYSGVKAQERIDFSSNHAFDFALTSTIIPLLFGLTIVICEDKIKKDPKLYLDFIDSNKINLIKITPGYFNVLLYQEKINNRPLKFLNKIILGGENLFAPDCASWLTLFPDHILFNEYGPTEAAVAVVANRIDRKKIADLTKNVPIGTLMPNCISYILDENYNPVSQGEMGELYIGGTCLARGYLNDKNQTAKYFIKDPFNPDKDERLYKTGDLCRQFPSGDFEYLGRIDEQVKIRGFRIEPVEIENFLLMHPALKLAAVKAIEGCQKDKKLVAYYILKNPRKWVNEKELALFLGRYLPDFMIPSFFIKMEFFPLTANEKIDRKALPLPSFTPVQVHEAPANHLENIVAEIWSNELSLRPISVNANFFELGGHSLSAAKIISNLTQVLEKEISLQDFYQNPTILSLCNVLKNQKKMSNRIQFSEKIYENSHLPLSDFQFTLWLSRLFAPNLNKLNICARKRFQGHIDEKKLHKAFDLLSKKHEVLSYHVSTFSPGQYCEKKLDFKLEIKKIEAVSSRKLETELEKSIDELSAHSWPRNSAPIQARLFYLKDNKMELQLCMPHMLADDASLEILFSDLSNFYLSNESTIFEKDRSYREYLFAERAHIQTHLDNDFIFWEDYLKDANLFIIPDQYVVAKMKKSQLSYTRYTEISKKTLDKLRNYCLNNHISLDTGLSGILFLALSNCCGELNVKSPTCFNKVKSTRDDNKYDKTLGCFLNVEPVKLSINSKQNLNSLCQQIHTAMITTSPYQRCSNLVKLACISNFRKLDRIKELSLNSVISLYNILFPSFKLNKKIINSSVRLNTKKANEFIININMQNSFLKTEIENSPLFGLTPELTPNSQSDILAIDNVLDVCFLRLDDQKSYMAVSANLTPEFQNRLSKEMLNLCESIQ
ncbi:MAG: amino acid adenylation domain-containing protein, partial [Tatlockia sp.]|nr:amino acid adenylation domain-containing protein [Tatlockia sp.]